LFRYVVDAYALRAAISIGAPSKLQAGRRVILSADICLGLGGFETPCDFNFVVQVSETDRLVQIRFTRMRCYIGMLVLALNFF